LLLVTFLTALAKGAFFFDVLDEFSHVFLSRVRRLQLPSEAFVLGFEVVVLYSLLTSSRRISALLAPLSSAVSAMRQYVSVSRRVETDSIRYVTPRLGYS
jgi:hypothetical protein